MRKLTRPQNKLKLKGEDGTIQKSTHKPLKSVRSVLIKPIITHKWNTSWKSQTHDAKQLCRITNQPNVTQGIKLYKAINTWHQATQLARLRTGHCSLNQFLHQFGFEESRMCDYGSGAIENIGRRGAPVDPGCSHIIIFILIITTHS